MIRRPPRSTLFPSTTLSRSREAVDQHPEARGVDEAHATQVDDDRGRAVVDEAAELVPERGHRRDVDLTLCGQDRVSRQLLDRKSTRLNSSHSQISYAVFCLK